MTGGHPGYPPPTPTTATPVPAWHTTGATRPVAPTNRRRPPRWIVTVAVVTAVASVVTFLTVLLWPAGSTLPTGDPLAFHGFLYRHEIPYDQPSRTTLSAVTGDTGYVGWEQGGNLQVVAVDLPTGEQRWRAEVREAPQWGGVVALPEAVLVIGHDSDREAPRPLVLLDGGTGEERWRVEVRPGDLLFLTGDGLTWLDRQDRVLRGLDLTSGDQRWSRQLRGAGEADAVEVRTPARLALPTGPSGLSPLSPDDSRIVLAHPDGSVQVIDGADGTVLTETTHVLEPGADQLLAYGGRLFVASAEGGYQVLSYDLADLTAAPVNPYTATDPEREPQALVPCGEGRICLLDQYPFEPESAQVVAVNAVDGGELWRRDAPGGQQLVPVDDWVIVNGEVDLEPAVLAFDEVGLATVERPGVAARLDNGNFLVFGASLDTAEAEAPVAGVSVADASVTDLGPPPDLVNPDCSWSRWYLLCPGRDAAGVWQFAETT